MRERIEMLIGDKRRLVLGLAASSILSGFTEAATLALLAQVATSLARGAGHVHQRIGPFAIHASLPALLEVAGVAIPAFTRATVVDADASDPRPVERR